MHDEECLGGMVLCSACLTTRLVGAYKLSGKMLCAKCTRRLEACEVRRPELAVRDFLEADPTFPLVLHNKSDPLTRTECCRRRVDLRMDYGYFQVIVEVDEHQHARYGEACEMVRLLDIVSASGGIATLLFRINPDSYRVDGELTHTPLADRLTCLKERITRRTQQVLRRIAANTSDRQRSLMPLLYVEYLYYSSTGAAGAKQALPPVKICSYHDDACLARAAQKCQ